VDAEGTIGYGQSELTGQSIDVSSRDDLDRLKAEFFADVSHELRTPIVIIKTLTDVLLGNSATNACKSTDLLLGNIQREVERMESLVDELVELGRLQSGGVHLDTAPCDLRDVVARAAATIEPLACKRLQVIEVVLPDDQVTAIVDATRLEQAVLNLLMNAHKYSFQQSVIRLQVEVVGGEYVLTVTDDGPGIPEEDRERIFHRFYRSPNPEVRRVQGSGLGLAIARSVVELHGGRITVDSPRDSGAVFRIHLPHERDVRP
jgi:signal transduction histidine kinase